MEFRFKSSTCIGEELVKSFNKDFKISFLSEGEHSEFTGGVTGTVKEIHVDKTFVLFQDYTSTDIESHTVQVVQNQPVFLLQYVLEGELHVALHEDASTALTLGKNLYTLFYIPKSTYVYKYSSDKSQVLNVYFTKSFLESKMGTGILKSSKKYQKALKKDQPCSFFDDGLMINNQLRNIIKDLLTCSFESIIRQSYIESKLAELLLVSLTSNRSLGSRKKIRDEDKERVSSIEDYIRTNLKEDLTIEKLSQLAGFNTSKFKTVFKQIYGIPVFKYITSLRIEKATELILNHGYTIAQASYEVGYKNPQHFTVAFKRQLGYLPSKLLN
ncbi:helix-turn-helix domain-containing protein [Aquimarina intermedia]|uniref:AraC-like DNA-binding protein n=1 Tax=Aquimarina intermedia TaxID=350814 RepID=A0A5S5C1B0_9FLAO|nr:AraC family transcriptional regulator [Aquimarina intermedia]TYP72120.1 AraC-like DNA-binding protein [Aquimarina intermedia]